MIKKWKIDRDPQNAGKSTVEVVRFKPQNHDRSYQSTCKPFFD